jgi:hypothetical protein
MRRLAIFLVALVPVAAVIEGCDDSDGTTGAPGMDAAVEAEASSQVDADAGRDAAPEPVEDASADAGPCPLYDEADKTCIDVSDCTMVARGCYCGQQPIRGIKTARAARATACEAKEADECALGCAQLPGKLAEDGQSDQDGGTITVECSVHQCITVVR